MAPIFFTKDHLLAVARRALAQWADDLAFAGAGGWDILRGWAASFSRASLAIGRFEESSFVVTATGPALATVTLTWTRESAAAGAVVIKAGTLVRASKAGATFRMTADLSFGALDVGPLTTPAVAVGYGEEWNVLGRYIAPNGDTMPGEIDSIDMLILDPPFVERSFAVTNHDDVTDGRLGMLDIHGRDVNLDRVHGENDTSYQQRIPIVDVAVSPVAVVQRLRQFFDAIGYTDADWYLIETWAHAFTSCYDAPELSYPLYPDYDPTLGVYDDPRPSSPIRSRWLDMPNAEGAGILEFRDLPAVEDWGGAYDDPALVQADLASSLGTRATTAHDLDDNVVTCRHSCYDGRDLERDRMIARLANLLDSITLHGVNTTLVAQGE